jgi:translation initiation factor 2 gamma subunit (eIF-2gamma)
MSESSALTSNMKDFIFSLVGAVIYISGEVPSVLEKIEIDLQVISFLVAEETRIRKPEIYYQVVNFME